MLVLELLIEQPPDLLSLLLGLLLEPFVEARSDLLVNLLRLDCSACLMDLCVRHRGRDNHLSRSDLRYKRPLQGSGVNQRRSSLESSPWRVCSALGEVRSQTVDVNVVSPLPSPSWTPDL